MGAICVGLNHQEVPKVDSKSRHGWGKETAGWVDPGHPLPAAGEGRYHPEGQAGATGSRLATDLDNPRTRQTLNEFIEDINPRGTAATANPLASLQQTNPLPQCLERHSAALTQSFPSHLNTSSY